MGIFSDTAALLGVAFGAMALWKVTQLEKLSKPHLKRTSERKNGDKADRRLPKRPRLSIPQTISPEALEFFRFYDDAIDHLNKLHGNDGFSFDNEGELEAPSPGERGSVPARQISIYYGEQYTGSIELKLWDIGENKVWADLQLHGARRYSGTDVEWLTETVAWLVVDSKDDLDAVKRATLDGMARWAWQLGDDAEPWGTFGERYEGNAELWRRDWVGQSRPT